MTDYAVGDIQGCYSALRRLLDRLAFDPAQDRLWVAGDIINRGPESLSALRFIRSLGDAAITVLGNHDLHLLAAVYGDRGLRRKDTLAEIVEAPDCDELAQWLRHQRVAYYDPVRDLFMAHAGLPHIWSREQAMALAGELETALRQDDPTAYFVGMYGNGPHWQNSLTGQDRLRAITNYFTRMRFIAEDGALDFAANGGLDSGPPGFRPWFHFPRSDQTRVVFGHWAALEGQTDSERYVGLDTGCVYGGQLTALNLDTWEKIHCDCG